MSNGLEERHEDVIELIKKLDSPPERDPQTAASGKSQFLAEARSHRASVSAEREERRMGWKENAMRLSAIPIYLIVIGLVGVAAVAVFMIQGPIIGNTFSTINSSLNSVNSGQPAPSSGFRGEAPAKPPLYGQQSGGLTPQTIQGLDRGSQEAPLATPQAAGGAGAPIPPGSPYSEQLVIKDANIRLLVKDTDVALDGVLQTITDVQGYLISSRTWSQDYHGTDYKYAAVTMGVPADQFENTLRRVRSLALRVLDESASGQDVSDQYVDLQSQVTNLEATRERIKGFLDQAQTVDQSLQINYQLSLVEAQIEQLKGQMNYLSGRAGYSTITINLEPELPEIVATPTPTMVPTITPTATPIAALEPWDVSGTTRQATNTLVSLYRLVAEFLIWVFLVVVPVLGPPALLVWLAVWFIQRRTRSRTKEQAA